MTDNNHDDGYEAGRLTRSVAVRLMLLLLSAALLFAFIELGRVREAVKPAEAAAHLISAHEEPRSGKWPAVRKRHLEREPACAVCGYKGPGLQVHHVLSFSWPGGADKELDDGQDGTGTDGNLITLCGPEHHDCHLIWGHLLDFKSSNSDVRKDAAWFREKIKNRPYKPSNVRPGLP